MEAIEHQATCSSHGNKRQISAFSSGSRRALRVLLGKTGGGSGAVLFTLECSKVAPSTFKGFARSKSTLTRDLARSWGCGIWRLELREGSVPRWHVLLWVRVGLNAERVAAEVRRWWPRFSGNWTGEAVQIEREPAPDSVARVLLQEAIEAPHVGRWWGYFGKRDVLKIVTVVSGRVESESGPENGARKVTT